MTGMLSQADLERLVGYRGLTPASDYNVDYAMHASTRMEPLLRDIRLGMDGAGMWARPWPSAPPDR